MRPGEDGLSFQLVLVNEPVITASRRSESNLFAMSTGDIIAGDESPPDCRRCQLAPKRFLSITQWTTNSHR